jgi:hypothetical protein
LDNENFDTKDFTIFISSKKWVQTIVRPLLELCAKEDSVLAMNCCSLLLILIKKVSESTSKKVKKVLKKKKKPSTGNSTAAATSTEVDIESDSESEDKSFILANFKDQIAALLSFKEGLCSGKTNKLVFCLFAFLD